MTRGTRLSWIVSLYIASCALPVFGGPRNFLWGFQCLFLIPWVCLFPAWWANPAFFVGCFLMGGRRRWATRSCGILGVLLAASFPMMLHGPGPSNDLQIGYVVWLASMVLLTVASFVPLGSRFKPARVAGWDEP